MQAPRPAATKYITNWLGAQVECLADIGVPAQFICMMASKAAGIMARTPEQLRAVADYVRGRGFEGSPPPSAVDANLGSVACWGCKEMQALHRIKVPRRPEQARRWPRCWKTSRGCCCSRLRRTGRCWRMVAQGQRCGVDTAVVHV